MNIRPFLSKDYMIILSMLLFVPIAGEINFYPVNETFRVSLGPPIFFLFLLFLRNTAAIVPGFFTAIAVVVFRVFLDTLHADFYWVDSFEIHYPTFFFYFTYSLLFSLAKVQRFHEQPLIIFLFGIIIEILADTAEFIAQYFAFGVMVTKDSIFQILLIAFSHSFIVLGVFSMMKLYETRSRELEIRKRNEHMLLLISNLYEESVHLKKTLQNSEDITSKVFGLYREMKRLQSEHMDQVNPHLEKISKRLLEISGEVHEIKKDNQRIFAGLSKLISNESYVDYIEIGQIIKMIVRTNEKYAQLLGKEIDFHYSIQGEHPPYHIYTHLSIINNLVANAVEAIDGKGMLTIRVKALGQTVEFRIEDDGPGIPDKHRALIFKPGFTSKFDHTGKPSTGIGLTYVHDMVDKLGGTVVYERGQGGKGSVFTIQLPMKNVVERE
ncbi:sensor histidine kinase [Halalkalibacterium halodurans]|uniref:sensor histidine kinase n=2 Tax=Halalkalibacterium halodurans TaxID=86665 RepID=UPI0030C92BBF